MNRFRASLLVGIFLNGVCHQAKLSSDFLPMTQGSSGANEEFSHARPAVRSPAHVAVVRLVDTSTGFRMIRETDVERAEHAAAAGSLPGAVGLVSLNRVTSVNEAKSYWKLDMRGPQGGRGSGGNLSLRSH